MEGLLRESLHQLQEQRKPVRSAPPPPHPHPPAPRAPLCPRCAPVGALHAALPGCGLGVSSVRCMAAACAVRSREAVCEPCGTWRLVLRAFLRRGDARRLSVRVGAVCRQMEDAIETAVAARTEAEMSAELLAVARRRVLDLEEEVRHAQLTRTEGRHHSRLLGCPAPGSVQPHHPLVHPAVCLCCGAEAAALGEGGVLPWQIRRHPCSPLKPLRPSPRCLWVCWLGKAPACAQ